jgi:cobalamin biosynthesis Co2+ chelatase CbiK
MKYVIRAVLLVAVIVLVWLTTKSVLDPIKYAEEVEKRENLVVETLKTLRDGQLTYKDEYGKFANSMDTLLNFMETGEMKVLILQGDKDDSTTVYKVEERMVSVKDSLFKEVDIPQLRFVPGSDTLQFEMAARVIKKNNVSVPVFEIKDPDPFSKERQKENNPLKVGSISDVNYNGNWD